MRGFALIELDEGRRADDEKEIVKQKMQAFQDLAKRSDWPSGAKIVPPVRRIERLFGEDHTPRYNLYVEVDAQNDEQFRQIFKMMETHCHVDGYGG